MKLLAMRKGDERGFSLVELLVVMVVLGIILAIAIPKFLGAKKDGQDTQAQAALRASLSAERTYYIDYQVYTTTQATLRGIEPNVVWSTTDAKQGGAMAATGGTPANTVAVLVSTAPSGNQFCIMSIAMDQSSAVNGQTEAGTYYLKKSTTVSPPSTSVTTAQCGTTGYTRDASAGWATS